MIKQLTLFDPCNIDSNKLVYINIHNILYFKKVDSFNYTAIYFLNDLKIIVKESVEEVLKILS